MTRRLIGGALRLYPRQWRHQHGDELAQLTEDLLDDPTERSWRVMASTVMGALHEQARPKYLGGGRLVGLGLVGAVVAVAALGLTYLVDHGPGVDLIPASAQSSGRLATPTGMDAVLDAQHVRVVVNGTPIPLPEIAGSSVGFEPTAAVHLERDLDTALGHGPPALSPPSPPAFRFSPMVAVKTAIAYQVLTALTTDEARRQGHEASVSAARAFAEKEYAAWRSHPVALSHGSGRPAFLSAAAVAGYRQFLTVSREEMTIAGPPDQGSRTPVLRRWMTRQLPRYDVVIEGVPGLSVGNLASKLPPHL